jgi:hypothetical protein
VFLEVQAQKREIEQTNSIAANFSSKIPPQGCWAREPRAKQLEGEVEQVKITENDAVFPAVQTTKMN